MAAGPNPPLTPIINQGPREFHTPNWEALDASQVSETALASGQAREPALNWLFVDLNSYFASVEQEVRPELRGRPVGIVPMMADTTCCIAASYEAKAYGVKTGTIVADAKRMCPGLVLVEARHEIYVDYHHRIVEAVESCLPVTAVLSIDEMACRLMGRERPLLAALDLGRRVKARIQERVGPMLRSSVGLATNRYLAKVASDMEKPDGLVALPLDILPQALRQLKLRDLPGVGAQTEKHLNERGIHSMEELLALDCEQAGRLWGSVWGERLWHWLRGEDFDWTEAEHLKSMSHQHVLAPEMRTPDGAWAVAHKLLHKAAMRLRAGGLWAGSIGLAIGFAVPRGRKAPANHPGGEDSSSLRGERESLAGGSEAPIARPVSHPNDEDLPPHPSEQTPLAGDPEPPGTPVNHPSDEDLPPGTPVNHPSDEDLPPGTPVNHPSDEDLPPGTPVRRFGVPTRGWKAELRLSECQDNQTLIAALSRLWASRPAGPGFDHPYFIGVHLGGLVPDRLHTLNLFDATEDEQSRTRLLAAMDALNSKYGLGTLAPATMLTAFKAAPTRIAFHSIPELF